PATPMRDGKLHASGAVTSSRYVLDRTSGNENAPLPSVTTSAGLGVVPSSASTRASPPGVPPLPAAARPGGAPPGFPAVPRARHVDQPHAHAADARVAA